MHKFTNMPKNRHNYKQRRPSMARTESTLINSHSTRRYSYHGRYAAVSRDPCNRCIIINPSTAKHPHSHRHAQKQANTTNVRCFSIFHTSAVPTPCYQVDTPAVSSTTWRCNESGRRGCTHPMQPCTPRSSLKPGWPGTRCTSPWCGCDRWRSCPPQCPTPTEPPRSTSSPRTVSCPSPWPWWRRRPLSLRYRCWCWIPLPPFLRLRRLPCCCCCCRCRCRF